MPGLLRSPSNLLGDFNKPGILKRSVGLNVGSLAGPPPSNMRILVDAQEPKYFQWCVYITCIAITCCILVKKHNKFGAANYWSE